MSFRSFAAACAAAFLACVGLVVLPASPAAASTSYNCKLSFETTNPLAPWNPSMSMKASPASPKVGQKVTVVVNAGSYTNGPVTLAKNKLKPVGVVALSGAQSGSFKVTGPPVAQVVGALKTFKVPPMTGTFTVTKAGSVTLSMKSMAFVYPGPPPVTTTCTAGGSGDSMGTVKVASTGTASTGGDTKTTGGTQTTGDTKTTGDTSGDDEALAQTGPITPAVLIGGLIALQLGLVVFVRSRRALR